MKKKGFATSAILYTLLLLFLVLMVGILNNLQNKKTILDALKEDTINALEKNTITDAILDQIAIINSKIVEIETKINDYEANTYTKTEVDSLLHSTPLPLITAKSQSDLDNALNPWDRYPNFTCTKEILNITVNDLVLEGGAWIVETCRTNYWGWQSVTKYSGYDSDENQPLRRLERNYISGTWGNWNTVGDRLMTIRVNTNAKIDEFLNNRCNIYSSNTDIKEIMVVTVGGLKFGGGNWLIETYCADSLFGYQIAKQYAHDAKPTTLTRSLYDGAWGTWIVD